ncbi:MAG: hypothetical protein IJ523_10075 [Succinivibrionaceae bacterium]|nr:hypothetical protein [Succinivibrionaceae bacterium]
MSGGVHSFYLSLKFRAGDAFRSVFLCYARLEPYPSCHVSFLAGKCFSGSGAMADTCRPTRASYRISFQRQENDPVAQMRNEHVAEFGQKALTSVKRVHGPPALFLRIPLPTPGVHVYGSVPTGKGGEPPDKDFRSGISFFFAFMPGRLLLSGRRFCMVRSLRFTPMPD